MGREDLGKRRKQVQALMQNYLEKKQTEHSGMNGRSTAQDIGTRESNKNPNSGELLMKLNR